MIRTWLCVQGLVWPMKVRYKKCKKVLPLRDKKDSKITLLISERMHLNISNNSDCLSSQSCRQQIVNNKWLLYEGMSEKCGRIQVFKRKCMHSFFSSHNLTQSFRTGEKLSGIVSTIAVLFVFSSRWEYRKEHSWNNSFSNFLPVSYASQTSVTL